MALLDRGLGGRRNYTSIVPVHVIYGGAVTYGPDVVVVLDLEGEVDLYARPRIKGQTQILDRLVRAVARGPDHVLRVYLLAALELDGFARDLFGHGVGKDLDALVEEPGAGGAPQGGVELGQDVGQGLYQVDPDAVGIYVRVVGGEMLVDEGVDLGSHLDPRRAPADHHESQLGVGHLIADEGDLLETLYNAVADLLGVLDSPHGQAVFLDTGNAEKVRLPAQRDNELVVRELDTPVGPDDLALGVDTRDHGPPEARAGEYERAPQGLGDVAGIDVAADDPRNHRPEGKEVVARYDEYPHVVAVLGQPAHVGGGRVPPEPPTEDQDLLLEFGVGRPLPGSVPGRGIERPPQGPEPQDQSPERQPALDQSVHTSLPPTPITAGHGNRARDPAIRRLILPKVGAQLNRLKEVAYEIATLTVLLRGPSNSARKTPCHRPRSTSPPLTNRVCDCPKRLVSKWESLLPSACSKRTSRASRKALQAEARSLGTSLS